MTDDIRANVALYYDLNPEAPADVPFYCNLVPSTRTSVLELGCGTGRVLVPLVQHCSYIQGIDQSNAMLAICDGKLRTRKIPATKAQVAVGDICDFNLDRTFDLIIAPYRLIQNLETDVQLHGLFHSVHSHLSPGGTCVLNVFRPKLEADKLRRNKETFQWEVQVEGGRVTCHDRRDRMDPDQLILYPELIWRRYRDDILIDEAILRVPMRCYYPEDFSTLIVEQGFRIIERWGGYAGEDYGVGPELVVRFRRAA